MICKAHDEEGAHKYRVEYEAAFPIPIGCIFYGMG